MASNQSKKTKRTATKPKRKPPVKRQQPSDNAYQSDFSFGVFCEWFSEADERAFAKF